MVSGEMRALERAIAEGYPRNAATALYRLAVIPWHSLLFLSCWVLCGCGLPGLTPVANPHTNHVVFIGDSITYDWSLYSDFQEHADWVSKGISGQTSFEVALRFEKDVIALQPRAVHIIVGTNDVGPGWQACTEPPFGYPVVSDTCANIKYMLQAAQRSGIKVVLGTIPPWGCEDYPTCGAAATDPSPSRYNRITTLNNYIKSVGPKLGATVLDYHHILADPSGLHYASGLAVDGVHPSQAGYHLMTPEAVEALEP